MKKIFKIVAIVLVTICSFGLFARITTNAHLFESKKKTETEQEHELQWVAVQQLEVGKKYKWKDIDQHTFNNSLANYMDSPYPEQMGYYTLYNEDGESIDVRFFLERTDGTDFELAAYTPDYNTQIAVQYRNESGIFTDPFNIPQGTKTVYDYIEIKTLPTVQTYKNYLIANLLEQA